MWTDNFEYKLGNINSRKLIHILLPNGQKLKMICFFKVNHNKTGNNQIRDFQLLLKEHMTQNKFSLNLF